MLSFAPTLLGNRKRFPVFADANQPDLKIIEAARRMLIKNAVSGAERGAARLHIWISCTFTCFFAWFCFHRRGISNAVRSGPIINRGSATRRRRRRRRITDRFGKQIDAKAHPKVAWKWPTCNRDCFWRLSIPESAARDTLNGIKEASVHCSKKADCCYFSLFVSLCLWRWWFILEYYPTE